MADRNKNELDERSPELKSDLEAQLDELGKDPAEVGAKSAGQSASSEGLSTDADATEDSVEDLSDTDQAFEAPRLSKASKMLPIIQSARPIPMRNTVAPTTSLPATATKTQHRGRCKILSIILIF